jgi:SAM-dependent methyltransferase
MQGHLHCPACPRDYPIAGGVPRLLARELAARHGAHRAQLRPVVAHVESDRRRALPLAIPALGAAAAAGGLRRPPGARHGLRQGPAPARGIAQFGAREVIGVDLSEAVDVAFANTRDLEHAHVVQGDIFHMPVVRDFDLAFSIGVLHHTPDPASAFAVLADLVKPGGTVACWVYGRENNGWIVNAVDPVRIGLTSRLPSSAVRALSFGLTSALFAGIGLVYQPASKLGIKPFYSDYMTTCANSASPRPRTSSTTTSSLPPRPTCHAPRSSAGSTAPASPRVR